MALATAMLLAGCALTSPGPGAAPDVPAAWSATRPHGASTVDLTRWWSQFDDPLLAQLIDAAQQNNADLAQAAARIAQARANARAVDGALWPAVNASASGSRARTDVPAPTLRATTTAIGLDAAWEIDLFGATRRTGEAARTQADARLADWHDLRVTLAAEVGRTYAGLRACEMLVDVFAQDNTAQKRVDTLTAVKVGAGLESRANGALAAASRADASNRLVAQRAECDTLVKSLVALTALPEPTLRPQLAARSARLPLPAAFTVDALPVAVLAQRPDLAAAEREVRAASSEVGAARADRYPRLSLTGSITRVELRSDGATTRGNNTSFGPAVSLPLFDAGRRAANVDAALARYEEARARWIQRAREAVREVETALVRLDAAERREADALQAAQGFRVFLDAEQARVDVGAGSLLDLESARRNALVAAATLINVQSERVTAWIALYKAMGGGWSAAPDAAVASVASVASTASTAATAATPSAPAAGAAGPTAFVPSPVSQR
jgi:multidrug efflux system outer membrane protein